MKKNTLFQTNNGFSLPLSLVVGVVTAILIFGLQRTLRVNSGQALSMAVGESTCSAAESGRNAALGALSFDGDLDYFQGSLPEMKAVHESFIKRVTSPAPCNYFITTTATRTVAGKSSSCTMYTYLRASGAGGYFAAVFDTLPISDPVDLGQAKVFANKLIFLNDGDSTKKTKLGYAEFVESVTPPLGNWVSPLTNEIVISSSPHKPVKLDNPILLPQVTQSELAQFEIFAGTFTTKSTFFNDIYPPGFYTGRWSQHVYFFDGPITIGGTVGAVVNGQVLIVSSDNIYISSGIVNSGSATFPGQGFEFGSKAHQLVLVTPLDVVVTPTFYTVYDKDNLTVQTQTIEAMIFAINGTFRPETYPDPYTNIQTVNYGKLVELNLRLNFNGAMILGTLSSPYQFSNVFENERVYSYMDSLRTSPPPYLPAITEIIYSFQKMGESDYNLH